MRVDERDRWGLGVPLCRGSGWHRRRNRGAPDGRGRDLLDRCRSRGRREGFNSAGGLLVKDGGAFWRDIPSRRPRLLARVTIRRRHGRVGYGAWGGYLRDRGLTECHTFPKCLSRRRHFGWGGGEFAVRSRLLMGRRHDRRNECGDRCVSWRWCLHRRCHLRGGPGRQRDAGQHCESLEAAVIEGVRF